MHDRDVKPTQEDISDLRALVERQKSQRKVSLQEIENVASELQTWVRAQGYPVAVAYVPSQTIDAGEVKLAVQLGRLAQLAVRVDGSEVATSSSTWGLDMPTLLGKPVTRQTVESRLNLFNRSGGDALQASFAPGSQVGETDMTLHVVSGRKFQGVARIENYSLRAFGQKRLAFRGSAYGLANMGDRLDAIIATSFSEKRQERGYFAYTTPLVDKGLTLGASIGVSDVQWRDNVEGRGTMFAADLLQMFGFVRAARREVRYQVGWQDLSFDGTQFPDQKVWFAKVAGEGHQLWDESKIAAEGRVGLVLGGNDNPYDANSSDIGGEEPSADQDDKFWRVYGDVLAWKAIDHPWFEKAVIRSRFQHTNSSLPTSQQVSLSRATNNPGLYPHGLSLDSLVEVGTDLYFARGHLSIAGMEKLMIRLKTPTNLRALALAGRLICTRIAVGG